MERPTPFLGRRDISRSRSIAASNASNVAKAAARRSGVGSGSGSDDARVRVKGRAIARMASMCGCASALLASPISGGLYELFAGCLRALSLGGGDATATSGGASGPVSGSISLYPPPHFWKYRGGGGTKALLTCTPCTSTDFGHARGAGLDSESHPPGTTTIACGIMPLPVTTQRS